MLNILHRILISQVVSQTEHQAKVPLYLVPAYLGIVRGLVPCTRQIVHSGIDRDKAACVSRPVSKPQAVPKCIRQPISELCDKYVSACRGTKGTLWLDAQQVK